MHSKSTIQPTINDSIRFDKIVTLMQSQISLQLSNYEHKKIILKSLQEKEELLKQNNSELEKVLKIEKDRSKEMSSKQKIALLGKSFLNRKAVYKNNSDTINTIILNEQKIKSITKKIKKITENAKIEIDDNVKQQEPILDSVSLITPAKIVEANQFQNAYPKQEKIDLLSRRQKHLSQGSLNLNEISILQGGKTDCDANWDVSIIHTNND